MKLPIKLLSLFLFVFILIGCATKEIHTDTLADRKEDLETIFGSYSLVDKSSINVTQEPIPAYVTGQQWKIEYTHNTLGKRIFTFTNVNSFDSYLDKELQSILQEDIKTAYLRPYFSNTSIMIPEFNIILKNIDDTDMDSTTATSVEIDYFNHSMTNLNAKFIAQQYHLKYSICFTDIRDNKQLETLQSCLTAFLSESTENTPNFNFSTKGTSDYHSSKCQYDATTETYQWVNRGCEKDKASIIDGRQMNIGRYSINDYLFYLDDKNRIQWSEEEQQYLCNEDVLSNILSYIGVSVAYEQDAFYWEIEGIRFTYNPTTPVYTANDEVLEGSSISEDNTLLLTTSLIETLTKTSIHYDDTHYMLTIVS